MLKSTRKKNKQQINGCQIEREIYEGNNTTWSEKS